jgi:hypothetical protein
MALEAGQGEAGNARYKVAAEGSLKSGKSGAEQGSMGEGNQVGRTGCSLVECQSGFRWGWQVDLPQPCVGRSGARQDCLALERDVDIGWVEGDGASMVTELAHG